MGTGPVSRHLFTFLWNVAMTIYHQPGGTGQSGPFFLALNFAGFCGTVGTGSPSLKTIYGKLHQSPSPCCVLPISHYQPDEREMGTCIFWCGKTAGPGKWKPPVRNRETAQDIIYSLRGKWREMGREMGTGPVSHHLFTFLWNVAMTIYHQPGGTGQSNPFF